MAKTLAALVQLKMDQEHISLRTAGEQAGVAHTTIDRVRKGKAIDLERTKKICDWVGIPVSSVVDVGEVKADMLDEVASLFAMNDEFSDVFTEIAEKVKSGDLPQEILGEITAFAAFRMDRLLGEESKKK